ncbi:MAG TPA: DNA primase, partial [Bacteroidota bacterium]|nr:DNA primase [Bacteroidota bacterium]
MRIPQEKIDEVRNATDIVDLIGGFVKLKKRGKNFLGLCPFHTEKTPSFNVSSDRQMYHCFGCGVGGNAFTFVMEYEKVSFVEAVRSLAEKAGIALPQGSSVDDEIASEQENLYNICREAGLYYYKALTESGEGKFAVEYFHKRGFTDETIRTFGLGYAPNSWDAIIKFGEQKNFSSSMLEKAGLVRKRDDGTYFDYFRGRAMFPIFSSTGRVIGFGARKLREDDPLGKYINSPETIIYNKSKILYGLFQAKESIREKDFAVLVEGYADLISVFQAGIKNVVASSGTALTVEQILLIGRYTKNITIMYDADSAGSSAALRGVDLILEHDLDVRVASLPEGDDPDSFVKKNGGAAFQKILDEAISFVDFIAQAYERQGKLKTPEGQAQVVRTIIQTIAKMKDELKRNFYIKHVAEKYKLYETTLYHELEKILGTTGRQQRMRSVPV